MWQVSYTCTGSPTLNRSLQQALTSIESQSSADPKVHGMSLRALPNHSRSHVAVSGQDAKSLMYMHLCREAILILIMIKSSCLLRCWRLGVGHSK